MIIGVHAHLGQDEVFDDNHTAEELMEKHERFELTCTIVQPATCHGLDEVMRQHDDIAALCQRVPGAFYGMTNPNPHLPDDKYQRELDRCVNELGFVGVKVHTSAHAVNPMGRAAQKVFEAADELNIPVMIHTGAGIPFANPSLIIPAAGKFPHVKFVLAHSGMMVSSAEIRVVLQLCPNVYTDTTWAGSYLFRDWIPEFGVNRFMFGSDQVTNCGTELAKIRTSGFSDEEQEYLLFKSALGVYHLEFI